MAAWEVKEHLTHCRSDIGSCAICRFSAFPQLIFSQFRTGGGLNSTGGFARFAVPRILPSIP